MLSLLKPFRAHRFNGTERLNNFNSWLSGELAAAESYNHVLSELNLRQQADAVGLKQIALEHWEMAETLKAKIYREGGEPIGSSGPWGFCVKAVTLTAQLLGKVAIVNALREGEAWGLKTYCDAAAASPYLDEDVRELLESMLIPKTRAHIPLLTRILEAEISRAFAG